MEEKEVELAGLIPAAGFAKRIAPIPVSKEVFPIGFTSPGTHSASYPRVVSSYLIEGMQLAGVKKILFVIRDGKWDIPSYYKDGTAIGLNIAYLVVDETEGAPFTIDKAYPFCREKDIVFGFPDIVFQPKDALKAIVEKKLNSRADIVLGLFEAKKPEKVDMVELSDSGKVQKIDIKPEKTDLTYTWLLAAWSPAFTQFLHDFVITHVGNYGNKEESERKEIYIGDVIQKAIVAGYDVESVKFPHGSYIDIGTKEDLKKAMKSYVCI